MNWASVVPTWSMGCGVACIFSLGKGVTSNLQSEEEFIETRKIAVASPAGGEYRHRASHPARGARAPVPGGEAMTRTHTSALRLVAELMFNVLLGLALKGSVTRLRAP